MFNILPLIVEMILTMCIIAYLYSDKPEFSLTFLGCILMYMLLTVVVTEWRAKYFRDMAKKDAAYN